MVHFDTAIFIIARMQRDLLFALYFYPSLAQVTYQQAPCRNLKITPTITRVCYSLFFWFFFGRVWVLGNIFLILWKFSFARTDKKAHRNGIRKPKTNAYPSLKGVSITIIVLQEYMLYGVFCEDARQTLKERVHCVPWSSSLGRSQVSAKSTFCKERQRGLPEECTCRVINERHTHIPHSEAP